MKFDVTKWVYSQDYYGDPILITLTYHMTLMQE